MEAAAGVRLRWRTLRRWAAREPGEESYLRPVALTRCAAAHPEGCPLRSMREFSCAPSVEGAMLVVLRRPDQVAAPRFLHLNPYTYRGPVAEIADPITEAELLDPQRRSPHWEELRRQAGEGQFGVIHLRVNDRVIIPPVALHRSDGRLEEVSEQSAFDPLYTWANQAEGDEAEDW